jgi:hypothetical protein
MDHTAVPFICATGLPGYPGVLHRMTATWKHGAAAQQAGLRRSLPFSCERPAVAGIQSEWMACMTARAHGHLAGGLHVTHAADIRFPDFG